MNPPPYIAPYSSSQCKYIYILPYLHYYNTTSLNLHLYFKTSTNTPGHFTSNLDKPTSPAPTASGAS